LDIDDYFPSGRGYQEGDEYVIDEGDDTERREIHHIKQNLKYERKEKYFRLDESESQALGLPLLNKDLPDTRKYQLTIGSMYDFTVLSHLSIRVKLLLGPQLFKPSTGIKVALPAPFRLVDSLPPNLKYLYVRGYRAGIDPNWDKQIKELMVIRTEKRPALKEVLGIDKEIPSQTSVDNPDDDEHLL
jgi:hypothetical protein